MPLKKNNEWIKNLIRTRDLYVILLEEISAV